MYYFGIYYLRILKTFFGTFFYYSSEKTKGKDSTIFLGWYANKEKITQEIMNIHNAILQGYGEYTLQYSVKTTRKWLKVQMVDEI
jgi:hypothetical protein